MKQVCNLLVLALLTCLSAMAQTTPSQPTAVPPMVYGYDNPALIPDSVAYRMVFLYLAVPSNATQEQLDTLNRRLRKFAFTADEKAAVVNLLQGFYDNYHGLITAYNAAVVNGAQPSRTALHTNRDNLVQQLKNDLKSTLSTAAMSNFDAYVQAQKVFMATQETQ